MELITIEYLKENLEEICAQVAPVRFKYNRQMFKLVLDDEE